MLKIAWTAFGPFKRSAIILFIVLLLGAVVETVSIGMILPLLEIILGQRPETGSLSEVLSRVLSFVSIELTLTTLCIGIVGIFLLKNGLVVYRSYLSHSFLSNLRQYWSCQIIDNYMFSEYRSIISHRRGTLLNNVINEPTFASKCLRDIIDIFAKLLLSIFIIVMLWVVSWPITLVGIFLGAVLTLMQWRSSRDYSYSIGKRKIQLNQDLSSLAAESLAGVRQIKIFSMENKVVALFQEKIGNLVGLLVKIGVVAELPKALGEVLLIGLLLAGLALYNTFVQKDVLTVIPMAGIFLVSLQRLFMSFSGLLSERISVLSYLPSVVLVYDTLQKQFPREEVRKGKSIQNLNGDIVFENLCFSYSGKEGLFNHINLSVSTNRITAITGPSGSGKSTLCDLLIGFFKPDAGQILIGGESMDSIDLQAWRKLIGYVSQENFLFNTSIRENIRCGKETASDEDVVRAAREAGAHEFIETFPEKYDTLTGESGSLLSGGQLQRIAIARALVRNPDILIFDEATSALDAQNEESILQLIARLKTDKTILLITHRLSALSIADHIYVLDQGQVMESGSYQSLMAADGLFWKLSQAAAYAAKNPASPNTDSARVSSSAKEAPCR